MTPVLPNDVFLVIFGHLCVQDILNARQVSQFLVLLLLFLTKCLQGLQELLWAHEITKSLG